MTFQEIMQIVFNSNRSDWSESQSPETIEGEKSYTVYAYKRDLNIHIKKVMGSSFREEWTNRLPDKDSYENITYIYYGATLVKQIILVGVDGGRATLPMPKIGSDKIISQDQYNYAKIFDSLDNLEEYISRSGLTVAD